jgi:hypothetical protein
MIVQNQLPNCHITIDDAKNMLQAYSPDMVALKGKPHGEPPHTWRQTNAFRWIPGY